MDNPNILVERYASEDIKNIFSTHYRIKLEIDEAKINEILKKRASFLGRAKTQIMEVTKKANYFFDKSPPLLNPDRDPIL